MSSRTDKIKLLNEIFNQGDRKGLQSLSRPGYPSVLIFEPQGERLLFSGRLNPTLPARYQGKAMDDIELNKMFLGSSSQTVFLLPDNFRN